MKTKEKQLLKTIALYFCEGGRDGDFYKDWIEDWTEEEIKQFELDFKAFNNAEDEYICPMLYLPVSCVLSFLLSKL